MDETRINFPVSTLALWQAFQFRLYAMGMLSSSSCGHRASYPVSVASIKDSNVGHCCLSFFLYESSQ